MKYFLLVLLCAPSLAGAGELLRISHVLPKASELAKPMVLRTDEGEEKLFVATAALLTEADVKDARVDPSREGSITVRLTKAGGKKLVAATKGMTFGQDRLAIVVDGKLNCAPIVHDTLSTNFVIIASDLTAAELAALAAKLTARADPPPRPKP